MLRASTDGALCERRKYEGVLLLTAACLDQCRPCGPEAVRPLLEGLPAGRPELVLSRPPGHYRALPAGDSLDLVQAAKALLRRVYISAGIIYSF